MKKNIWRRLFVLPLIPSLLVMGAACILWWSGQVVRGIALCASGLIFIVRSAHLIQRMSEWQKEAIRRDFSR